MRAIVWVAVVAGLAAGLASGVWALGRFAPAPIVVNGWATRAEVGSADADPWTRASVARNGLLALTAEQAVYFDRTKDDDGRPLRQACVYRLTGGPMPAGWWSVTLYAADQYLARNADGRPSIDATQAGPGAWSAQVSASPPSEGPWISSRAAGEGFVLMLRLYGAQDVTPAGLAAVPTPRLERLSCGGAP